METNANKQYRRVPFTIELAKKIQSGEIEGRIVNTTNMDLEIVSFNAAGTPAPIVAITTNYEYDSLFYFDKEGFSTTHAFRLIIELPEETPKHEFKPFDKVLVRDENIEPWSARLYDNKRCQWHFCQDGHGWNEAIPFEGNEHLVGTTDKPKEV